MHAELAPLDEIEGLIGAADWLDGRKSQGATLKRLTPKHQQIGSMLAQGFKPAQIVQIVGISNSYLSVLQNQPLMKQYIRQLSQHALLRAEALTERSIDVIAEVMETGSDQDKLKAARLQLEATKKIGAKAGMGASGEGSFDRLTQLAERLVQLQTGIRAGRTFNETGEEITEVEFTSSPDSNESD